MPKLKRVLGSALGLIAGLFAMGASAGVLQDYWVSSGRHLKPISSVGHWTILSDSGSCVLELAYPEIELAFDGSGPLAWVVAEAPAWNMPHRTGWIGLHPKPSGNFLELEPAEFGPDTFKALSGTEILQTFLSKWASGKATSLEIQDDRHRVLATVPIAGLDKALPRWNACLARK